MKPTDFLLALLDACRGPATGRMALQALAYFVLELVSIEAGVEFEQLYFGPMSPELEFALGDLMVFKCLSEDPAPDRVPKDAIELHRCMYRLTARGEQMLNSVRTRHHEALDRITGAVALIRGCGELNEVQIAVAARVHSSLKRSRSTFGVAALERTALGLDWKAGLSSRQAAVAFLGRFVACQPSIRR